MDSTIININFVLYPLSPAAKSGVYDAVFETLGRELLCRRF